jgi:hypothetical protein
MSQAAGASASDQAGSALQTSVAVMGLLRLGVAGWTVSRPRQAAIGLGVSEDQQEAAVPYVYALVARELMLGLGALRAWRTGSGGALWMAAIAASDAFDAVVYQVLAELGTLDRTRARRATLAALGGAVPEGITAVALVRHAR